MQEQAIIPYNELKIGQAYYASNGEIFLYLGFGKVTCGDSNKSGYLASSIGYLMMAGERMIYHKIFYSRISIMANRELIGDLESCMFFIKNTINPWPFVGEFNYKSPVVEKHFRYISDYNHRTFMQFDLED